MEASRALPALRPICACLATSLCLPCTYQGLAKNQSKFQVFDGVS